VERIDPSDSMSEIPQVRLSKAGIMRLFTIAGFLLATGTAFIVWPGAFLVDLVPSATWIRVAGVAVAIVGGVILVEVSYLAWKRVPLLEPTANGGHLVVRSPGRLWGRLSLPVAMSEKRDLLFMESHGKRRVIWRKVAERSDLEAFVRAVRH